MQQSSILFIVPYFGSFPNYFQQWLNSCSYNPTINWLIITDNQKQYDYPSNVKVVQQSFNQLQQRFKSFFSMPIILETPYDFCEFKVAYGEVFSDELNGYDFWGHCDIDLIWGNIRSFITSDILSKYSKISWRGHMTLYKNTPGINSIYRKELDQVSIYQYAFNNPTQKQYAFDERGINFLFEKEGKEIYKSCPFADLKIRNKNFELLHFDNNDKYKNKHQIFYWCNGRLYRLYVEKNQVHSEEFLYIHFLKRPMKVKCNNRHEFMIVPNQLVSLPGTLSLKDYIIKHSRQGVYWSYWIQRLKPSFLINKLKYRKEVATFMTIAPPIAQKGYSCTIPSINQYKVIDSIAELRTIKTE